MEKQKPKAYLIIFNIQKKKNLGTLVRSAAAFNITEIFFVDSGQKKIQLFGSQGTSTQMTFRKFPTFASIRDYCTLKKIKICGVQILEDGGSIRIEKHPFSGSTAFMLGNQGSGLNKTQLKACDFCVYVAQHTHKTASLNIAVAGSIVLHHFALWAQFEEAKIEGQKFKEESEVAEKEQSEQISEEKKEEGGKKEGGMKIIEMEADLSVQGGVRELSIAELKERKQKQVQSVEMGGLFDE